MFLRAVVGAVEPEAGLAIAPEIPAKKVQGALTFAQPGAGESPLALVDTSVLLSGKSGVLLTDRAVYIDAPRARVPLEAVVYPPVTKSAAAPAHLPTAMGPVTLPTSTDACNAAVMRLLRAVALYNRGASRFAYGHAPVHGPVGEAAAAALRQPFVAAPAIPRAMHATSNVAHGWLDHDTGEELLGLLDETVGREGTQAVAFTDRRVIVVGPTPQDIPYSALTGVSLKTGMLSQTILLITPGGTVKVDTLARDAVAREVADFLARLGSIPPAQRHAAFALAATPDDPSGAAAAMRALPMPDPRVATLLELVHAAVARGAMTADVGLDFAQRALRLQRTLRGGHGRTGVMQRSPLSAADLPRAFSLLLGAPAWTGFEANGAVLDFDVGRAGSAAGTIASNVVGIALLAVVGVGWVTTGSGTKVSRVRVRVWEGPGGAGFALTDTQGAPLAAAAAKLAAAVLEGLAELSAEVLLRRVLHGWAAPLDALLAEPAASLDGRARSLVPHADVAPFFQA
jgi:hypothetical protein